MELCVWLCHVVAVSVRFEESSYSVDERNGLVHSVLILSSPSSASITIGILNINGNATGMCSLVIL